MIIPRNYPKLVLCFLLVMLLVSMFFALSLGPYPVRLSKLINLFTGDISIIDKEILLNLRLPRIVGAVLVGGGLGASGAALQGLFRNPLADPALIGVAAGASAAVGFGIVLGRLLFPNDVIVLNQLSLPLMAIIGALTATLLVLALSHRQGRTDMTLMLLIGIGVNALASALIGSASYFANDEQLRALSFWGMGSLSGLNLQSTGIIGLSVVIGYIVISRLGPSLDVLQMGESSARAAGVDIQAIKYQAVVAVALIVGTSTAFCGTLSFVALAAAHIFRLVFGPNHRLLFPGAALLGAFFVLCADSLARTIVTPTELPIGLVTATVGAPLFLWILWREQRSD